MYFNRYKNKYITEILKVSPLTFLKKFLLLTFVFFNISFSLHAAERQNIVTKSPLTIAVSHNSFPYHFFDENGRAAGLMPELWRLWAKKQQVDIEFVKLPWLETLDMVAQGKVDIHAGLSIIDNRKDALAFSSPLFPLYTHVYVNVDLAHINSMEDLTPYALGVVNGSAHIDILNKQFPDIELKIFPTRDDLYNAAIQKDILVFAGLEKIANNYKYYQQLISMFPYYKRLRYQQGEYGIAVAKNNNSLLEFINVGLNKISIEEKSAIERKWLGVDKRKDSLSIGFPANYAPYSAVSPTGQPQGLLIDMWRLWAEQTDTKINFVAASIEDSFSLIERNELDVFIACPDEWLNNNKFSLANPIYQVKGKVFVNKKILNVESLNYFAQESNRQEKVGIWHQTVFKNELKLRYPKVTFEEYQTIADLLQAAELNEISAFVANVDFMNLKLLSANLQSLFYTLDNTAFNSSVSPLVKKGNTRLINMINEGFNLIEIEKLVKTEKRWLNGGDYYYKNLLEQVLLSKEEKLFLAKDNIIDVGVLTSRAPIEFVNADGEFVGIDRDILDLIAKRTGLVFNYIPYDSWYQLYKSMLAGDIDLITSFTPTESRKGKLLFSEEYWQTPWAILHPHYFGPQPELKGFQGKKLAIIKGVYLIDYFAKNHPSIELTIVKNNNEGLLLLQQGKVEGLVATVTSASQMLKQESLVSLMVSPIEEIPIDRSHFGINKNKKELQSIIDKGLLTISKEDKYAIHDKWFSLDINTGLDKAVVLRVAAQAMILIIVVLVIILLWNRRLNREIKRRMQLEKNMKHMATHDALTGLANRVLLKDRINTAIEFHQRQSLMLAVLFLDLDGFKEVNDTYGHDVGDELLLIVAKRLQSCVRKSDTVVRFGGDEFVLLLTGLHADNEAAYVAEKVLELMQNPFELSAETVQIGCSIGIALYPENGTNEIDLLKEADTLMYQVKSAGKNHYRFKTN